jgi:hypothetical protein
MIGFWKLREGESGNISNGCPSEVKEMLKEFGDDPFGMTKSFLGDDGGRSSATPPKGVNTGRDSRGLAELASPLSVVLAGIADVFE